MTVSLGLLVRLLGVGVGGDILEGDCALDFLAGEDGLVVPVYEDAEVAVVLSRRHVGWDRGDGPSGSVSSVEEVRRDQVRHLWHCSSGGLLEGRLRASQGSGGCATSSSAWKGGGR